ncbi:MAG: peptidylprolyl isomerase [Pseudohongiellaceae bacterium]
MIVFTTTFGDIHIELDFDNAPVTARNFLEYARNDFYTGTIFHRVIDGFMVQGGGFEPGMQQKDSGEPIRNEADNGLSNDTGTLAMARTADPHSASAQFFINVADNHFLNHRDQSMQGWGYAVFGRVADGMDVVDRIRKTPTGSKGGHQDVPQDDVIITATSVTYPDEQ